MDAREFIDSEDDEKSTALKIAANAVRLARVDQWRPPTVIVDVALEAEYLRLFEELIQDGADWRQLNADGQNLMHVAVQRNNLPVVRQLLALGLDASRVDINGNVPMSLAKSAEIIALLPAADTRHVTPTAQTTPLTGHLLANRMQRLEDEHVVQAMLSAGADVHYRNADGETALMMTHSAAVARRLLAAGADINAQDIWGKCALYAACTDGDSDELVRVLLAHPGVDPWLRTVGGESTMHCVMGHIPSDELTAVVPLALDSVEFERVFVERAGGLQALRKALGHRGDGDDDVRRLRILLEDARLDVHDGDTHWSSDGARLLLECGAHVSQRANKRPLDWSRFPAGGGLLDAIEVFAAVGFVVDFRLSGLEKTALQRYCECTARKWPQTQYEACLIAVGADYRLRRREDDGWLLDDSVFRSFYEWDGFD